MATATPQQIATIDDKHYNTADFNENALAQLANLRFTDEQLQLLGNQQSLAATAQAAYLRVLADNLPEKKAAANKKKDVVTVDGNKYSIDDFNEQGRAQLSNVHFAEQEITRLKNLQAVLQTSRTQYGRALSEEISKLTPVKPQ